MGKIWLLVATGLVLMHSLVPHQHHSENSADEDHIQAAEATELIDLFQLAFHLDLGEDHFEHFETTDHSDIDFNVARLASDFSAYEFIPEDSPSTFGPYPTQPSPPPAIFPARQFRGPPRLT